MLGLLLASASGAAWAWNSRLYPLDAGRPERPTLKFAGREWRLPDFSYAGYRLGARPLASELPCVSITIQGRGDIREELQAAVDGLGRNGGGTVLIPAGHYALSGSVYLAYSNVAIQGAGSELSLIDVPATYAPTDDREEGVFTLGADPRGKSRFVRGWWTGGATLATVSANVEEGASSLRVKDASQIEVGQWVVVTQYFWRELAMRNSGASHQWEYFRRLPKDRSAAREWMFGFLRQVVGKEGRILTLDAPIPRGLNPDDNPVILRAARDDQAVKGYEPLHDLGIAGLSIRFADNRNGRDDRHGVDRMPTGTGVYLQGLRDAWVHDVRVRNAPRYGVVVDDSARVTVQDSAVIGVQAYFGDWGYGFLDRYSQNLLYRRNFAQDTRHGYISHSALSSANVYTQNTALLSRGNDDLHFGLQTGILWDAHRSLHGSGLQGINRGDVSGGAYESWGSGVVWNWFADGWRGHAVAGGALYLNPSSDGYALVGGGPGAGLVTEAAANTIALPDPFVAQVLPFLDGLQVGDRRTRRGLGSRDQNVLYEGLGRPGLEPASLYEEERRRRLGAVADYSSSCRAPPIAGATPALPSVGSEMLVFDGTQPAWLPSFDASGCATHPEVSAASDDINLETVDCTAEAYAPGQSYPDRSLRLKFRASDGAAALALRGPVLDATQLHGIRLRVFPTGSQLRFRLRLTLDTLAVERTVVSRGEVQVGGAEVLNPGVWNEVRIPFERHFAGRFNSVELSPYAEGAAPFYVDDVRLDP